VRTCTWRRVIRSTRGSDVHWTVSIPSQAGLNLTVEPNDFTLTAGAEQLITVTANVGSAVLGSWNFSEVRFSGSEQTLHFTVAARPVTKSFLPVIVR